MHVKCPYCEFQITRLPFRMIEVREDRFTQEQIAAMQEQIETLEAELQDESLDTAGRLLRKNQIERLTNETQEVVRTYCEKVYYCPSCEKMLGIIPSNDIRAIIQTVRDGTYDIRKLS